MKRFKLNVVLFMVILISVIFLSDLRPFQYSAEKSYLIVSYVISFCIYWFACNRLKFDFFHPIHIYFIFYFFIFFVTPLFLIDSRDTMCVEDNVMDGCIRGTIIVVAALASFTIGYLTTKNKIKIPQKVENLPIGYRERILKLSYLVFCFFMCVQSFMHYLQEKQ